MDLTCLTPRAHLEFLSSCDTRSVRFRHGKWQNYELFFKQKIWLQGNRAAFPRVTNAWDHRRITSQALSPTWNQPMRVKAAARDDRRIKKYKLKLDSFQGSGCPNPVLEFFNYVEKGPLLFGLTLKDKNENCWKTWAELKFGKKDSMRAVVLGGCGGGVSYM